MLVGKRSCGYGRARGKFAPVRCTTLLLSFRLTASPLGPGSHPIPRRRNPFPWSSRSPGSLPPPNVVPPRRQFSLVLPPPPILPGAASRYSRIPVSPPPSPRCIADESIPADILTHWRSMPRSRERRRPQPPTFPTLQSPSRSQTRALGRVGRRLPPLTKPLSVPIVQARRHDETAADAITNVECIAKSSVLPND